VTGYDLHYYFGQDARHAKVRHAFLKVLGIKIATTPFQHLLVLGNHGLVDQFADLSKLIQHNS
jgi:hypothetical protein